MLFLLKLPYIARSERTPKSKSRSNLFYSPFFLTKKQCDHENHNHIRRSTYEGHQYIYWINSSSFETQVARNSIVCTSSEDTNKTGSELLLLIHTIEWKFRGNIITNTRHLYSLDGWLDMQVSKWIYPYRMSKRILCHRPPDGSL